MEDMTQEELAVLLEEFGKWLSKDISGYNLSEEQMKEFLAMDQRATHAAPVTLH
jgi:hypothetical protein